jgi:hypothetical protein
MSLPVKNHAIHDSMFNFIRRIELQDNCVITMQILVHDHNYRCTLQVIFSPDEVSKIRENPADVRNFFWEQNI